MGKVADSVVDKLKQEAATNGEAKVTKDTTTLIGIPSNQRLKFFQDYAPQISQLIPHRDDLNAARIVQLSVQLTDNPKIAECHPKSIIGAVMQSVILGFEPIPGLGLAAFVPYAKQLTFQIMYQGLIDLAYRTDMYDAIYAEVVREGDIFKYNRGLHPDIVHEPKVYKGDITHVYAVAHLKGSGQPMFVVMPWEEVIEIRNRSSHGYDKQDSPWKTRPGEMGKKTALKQLMKILPKSVTIQKAVASDERSISVDDFKKETKEVDYSKMAEDATFQDIPDKKKPEPEKSDKKSKPAKKTPEPTPEPKKEPEPTKDTPGPEKEPEKPKPEANPKDVFAFEMFGKPFIHLDEDQANEVLDRMKTARDRNTKDMLDKEAEETPPWGTEEEVEKAAKAQDKAESEIGDEDIKGKVDELKSETLLKDAFEESEYKRMIKYLRERANDAREALAFFTDEKAPKGIHNLGELCAYFDVNALTAYDITVAQYEAIKEFITEVKKNHPSKDESN